jgi:peroxiredoxin
MEKIKRTFLFLLYFLVTNGSHAQSYYERYDKCSEILKDISWEDTAYMYKAYERDECLIGAPAPDFTAKTMKGKQIQLSKLKGQVIVLNFWSTGCAPCIEEMPQLNKLVKHYAGKKVTFISLAFNNAETLRKFFVTNPFEFTTIPSAEKIGNDVFKLPGVIPYTIVIDQNNTIRKMWFGNAGDATFSLYQEIIDKALKD